MTDQTLYTDDYNEALERQARRARQSLGDDYGSRRLGGKSTTHPRFKTDPAQDRDDMAIIRHTAANAPAPLSKEEVYKQVANIFRGNSRMTDTHLAAFAQVAYNMELDPNPAVGHLYGWFDSQGRFIIAVGYQGYLYKAQKKHQFFHTTREMTPDERALHALDPDDVGAVCEFYEMERARMAREIGLDPQPLIGIGIWKGKRAWDDKKKEWKSDNVPVSKSPFWVAQKNAVKDAVRQLGIGFSLIIPRVDGFAYAPDLDSFVEESDTDDFVDADYLD